MILKIIFNFEIKLIKLKNTSKVSFKVHNIIKLESP